MKFSEAILLGSTTMRAKAGVLADETGAGCALGMAAVGMGYELRPGCVTGRAANAAEAFGLWLNNKVNRPCSCWSWPWKREPAAKEVLTHLFDVHVMDKRDWTLDELAAWIATIEPEDSQPAAPAEMERVSHE